MVLPRNTREKIFEVAESYNIETQIDVLIEEMSELTKALLKNRRAHKGQTKESVRNTEQSIIEEVADVEIMIQQIIYLFEIEDEVLEIIESKLVRQLERIKKQNIKK